MSISIDEAERLILWLQENRYPGVIIETFVRNPMIKIRVPDKYINRYSKNLEAVRWYSKLRELVYSFDTKWPWLPDTSEPVEWHVYNIWIDTGLDTQWRRDSSGTVARVWRTVEYSVNPEAVKKRKYRRKKKRMPKKPETKNFWDRLKK